jgi:hypothetical protein
MPKDSFYEKILEGLAGPLNPQDFEDCIADLLRDVFPGLVPVRGGKDSGMDGAIADGEGEPFPLVTTTAEDVERNLMGSLDAFQKRRQPARKVVFATSQSLTPQRRLKLMDLVRERDLKLVQIFEQRGVADRLYRDSVWCKKLLGLSGQPSALSAIPISRRPLLDLEPIGRDQDLEWLRQTVGDLVLSGEPGSGKTFLLHHLAREGWGLFLVNPDGDIAGALRDQQPRVVIVDDAHAQPDILLKLIHLRQEVKADFSIVATTWEGGREQVAEAMGGIPVSRVHRLQLLTRDEILKIFRSVGINESPIIMRHLVDQAANKPGLATTIATLWLQESWQDVIDGKALSRTLLDFFQKWVGSEATEVLAAFSLGGDRGMGIDTVREFLGLNRSRIWQITNGLAAGGVLSEIDRDTLAIWPRPLRSALIRTVFFPPQGSPRLPYLDLVKKAPSLDKAAESLVEARGLDANIPESELRALVASSGSLRAWNGLAQLSERDAQWVLESYPGDLVEVGESALLWVPAKAIEKLLKRAVYATGSTHSNPDHPMRILSDWVRELDVSFEQPILRRQLLAKASTKFIKSGSLSIGVHGICLALSPALESGSLDPGAGRTFTISSGLLGIEQLRQVEKIWEEARAAITSIDETSWGQLSNMLWEWVYPDYAARSVEIPEEVEAVMHTFAAKVLGDLVPLAYGSPGLALGLENFASELGIQLGLERNRDFEALYPSNESEESEGWKINEERQLAAIRDLAAVWREDSPSEVAHRVTEYENEANRINRKWPRRTPELCREIAAVVTEPEIWLDAFMREEASRDLVEPFLSETLIRQRGGVEQILERCLRSDLYVWLGTEFILQMSEPPRYLLKEVLEEIGSFPRLAEALCLRKQVSLSSLKALLEHPTWEVALAAAIGEWLSEPKGEVRGDIAEAWRMAVLQSKPGEHSEMRYWLGEIFSGNEELAFQWLISRLEEKPDRFFLADRGPFSKAIHVLGRDKRVAVLNSLGDQVILRPLISLLVGKDPEIYRILLQLQGLSRFHQEPLAGVPDESWADLAMMALEAGYDTDWIARASFYIPGVVITWESEVTRGRQSEEGFARLEANPRSEIQEIGRHGRRIAQEIVQRAKEKERQEEIHGV